MTKATWDDTWNTNIYQFFNVLAFSRDYNNEQQKRIQQWQRLH